MINKTVLVTGATGYVGGRLVRELLNDSLTVRVLVRDKSKIQGHSWANEIEIVEGDALSPADLEKALTGISVAYYLLHSLNTGAGFQKLEIEMAEKFATAAKAEKISQIIYLGGINNDRKVSKHLSSRAQVGVILRSSGIPTIELRAGMILGSGSASFEMLRHLTHRLPIMTTPKWIHNKTHPIAVRDVLWYLRNSAGLSEPVSGIFDIGGPESLTYAELMQNFARASMLPRRIIISLPVLTPRLASHWIGLVTPLPTSLAKNLVESLISEVIVDPAKSIDRLIPAPPEGLLGVDESIKLALQRVNAGEVDTRWSDAAGSLLPWDKSATDPDWAGAAVYKDVRQMHSTKSSNSIWQQIESIGGETGWYGSDYLWAIRGFLDTLAGGVGLRRGRRHPSQLRAGESLDFWRVEEIQHGKYLRLRAEMKLPGEAWLEFDLSEKNGTTHFTQTATYIPRGLFGNLYWYSVAPFHSLVFPTMLRNIERSAAE